MADMGPKNPGAHVVPEEVLISDESILTKRFRHRLGAGSTEKELMIKVNRSFLTENLKQEGVLRNGAVSAPVTGILCNTIRVNKMFRNRAHVYLVSLNCFKVSLRTYFERSFYANFYAKL